MEQAKHPGGAPPKYETAEEFEEMVDKYFDYIKGEFEWVTGSDEEGNPADVKRFTRDPEPPTITGMCLYLGFESRQSFYDYMKREKFSYCVKRAHLRIERGYEVGMQTIRNPAGNIFILKNLGWSDKQEIDHSSKDGSMTPTPIKFTKGQSNG